MRFTVSIGTDNAAFGDTYGDTARELADILRKIATELDCGQLAPAWQGRRMIRDSNGNTVGHYGMESPE